MTERARVAIVPGVLAFLPEYAGQVDPVPDVRAAALAAVAWLAEDGPVKVVADDQGARVARHLLAATGGAPDDGPGRSTGYLVVANGSARRRDSAPGYVDARAVPYDAAVEAALRLPDPDALAATDVGLGAALLAGNAAGLAGLGTLLRGAEPALVDYADDPYGVQYWVMRWVVTDLGPVSEGK